MWLLLAFLSAALLGFYDAFKKQALKDNAVLPVLFLNTVFSSLIFLPFILVSCFAPAVLGGTMFDVPVVGWGVHKFIIIKSFIVLSSWIFGYFGMKHLPLTIVGPINATRPVMVLVGAMLVFGERLNLYQWIGVMLAVLSFFMLSRSGKKEGIDFKHNKWILFIVLAAVTGAVSGLYDKYLMKQLPPMVVQSWYNIYQVFIMCPIILLLFLAVSAVLNVILDLVCVLVLHWGVQGAAAATTFSQFVSGIGIGLYTLKKFPQLCPKKEDCRWDKQNLATILNLSVMTSVQQSIMNFGILMVQGLVNSFGTVIMAAFAAAVKIDSFAYMPVQDFGNAFSTYVAQNYGAGQTDRIRKGIRSAGLCSAAFCIVISVLVCAFAAPLMGIFIDPAETAILAAGVHYLHIEGACYLGIGILFLLYGYYRAVNQPQMSVVLTIASLGTRVALAYLLSATPLGVTGIWLSVPIGWALADAIGIGYYLKKHRAKYAVQA